MIFDGIYADTTTAPNITLGAIYTGANTQQGSTWIIRNNCAYQHQYSIKGTLTIYGSTIKSIVDWTDKSAYFILTNCTFTCKRFTLEKMRHIQFGGSTSTNIDDSYSICSTENWYFANSGTNTVNNIIGTRGTAFRGAENGTFNLIYPTCRNVSLAFNLFAPNSIQVSMINPTLTSIITLVQFQDLTWYTTAKFFLKWYFDLLVQDRLGVAIPGALVKIVDGTGTVIASLTTAADGTITQQSLTEGDGYPTTGIGTNVTKTFTRAQLNSKNPYTVTITKSGYVTKVIKYTIDRVRAEVEVLENRREI